MKNLKIFAILTILLFGTLAGALYLRSKENAPPLQVYSIIEKKYVNLPESNDEPALVLFWTTTCMPCKVEMKRLQNAILTGKIPGGKVYAVNIGEPIETVEAFALATDLQFQFFADPETKNIATYKVAGTPTTYYFNKDQQVVEATTGIDPKSIEKAEALFSAFLK